MRRNGIYLGDERHRWKDYYSAGGSMTAWEATLERELSPPEPTPKPGEIIDWRTFKPSGVAPVSKEPCATCSGFGYHERPNLTLQRCWFCQGSGWIEAGR